MIFFAASILRYAKKRLLRMLAAKGSNLSYFWKKTPFFFSKEVLNLSTFYRLYTSPAGSKSAKFSHPAAETGFSICPLLVAEVATMFYHMVAI
jgi:hypothetical protein